MIRKLIQFDWAIKKMLRHKANFDILEGFLSELLNEKIKIKQILDSESNKETENDKFNRVDMLVLNYCGRKASRRLKVCHLCCGPTRHHHHHHNQSHAHAASPCLKRLRSPIATGMPSPVPPTLPVAAAPHHRYIRANPR